MESQDLLNISFGIISVLAGWVFKMIWGRIKDLDDDLESLEKHHEEDLKEARKDLSQLALSMPEKYVAKQDLDKLIEYFNGRFDKIEEKIDQIKRSVNLSYRLYYRYI